MRPLSAASVLGTSSRDAHHSGVSAQGTYETKRFNQTLDHLGTFLSKEHGLSDTYTATRTGREMETRRLQTDALAQYCYILEMKAQLRVFGLATAS